MPCIILCTPFINIYAGTDKLSAAAEVCKFLKR